MLKMTGQSQTSPFRPPKARIVDPAAFSPANQAFPEGRTRGAMIAFLDPRIGRRATSGRRPMPPSWEYFSRAQKKPNEPIPAPKGRGSWTPSLFPC
jgi:hypothetical protein